MNQQQAALAREPGFGDLALQEQHRLFTCLGRLQSMPLERRRQMLARLEAFERLDDTKKRAFHDSVEQFVRLSTDRRRMRAQAYRRLARQPDTERDEYTNSTRFADDFSAPEQKALLGLLTTAPYLFDPENP